MAVVHSKNTVVKIGSNAITGFSTNSQWERSADVHDVTTYGKDDHVFSGGLRNGAFTVSGVYDNGASNTPRTLLDGQEGTSVTIVQQPEGTGTGKPQRSVSAVVQKYVETFPVANMITWSCDFQPSDSVTRTTQ